MRSVLVVGGALAGLSTLRSLRKAGYDGPVTVVGDEVYPPYDRPPLSKEYLLDQVSEADLSLAMPEEDLGAEWLHSRAVALHAETRTVTVDDGTSLTADAVVVATGARARALPGLDERLSGVHTLRTLDDARALRWDLRSGGHVVVVGAGFVGAEITSAAVSMGCTVTVLEAAPAPLVGALGRDGGAAVAALHAANGVGLRCATPVAGIEGTDRVERVRLADGDAIPADVVVVGIGSVPEVAWLEGSGLRVEDGVVCDDHGRTSVPGVYAVGDCAAWFDPALGRHCRVEHWTDARDRPTRLARAALGLGDDEAPAPAPYFWSDQYGVRIQFAGHLHGDEVLVVEDGSTEGQDLLATYQRDGRTVAVLGMNRMREMARWRRRLVPTPATTQKGDRA